MLLRRADRPFGIIRSLRASPQPVTAAAMADELEVTVHTVPDFATLQAHRIRSTASPASGMYCGGATSSHH